MPIRHFFNPVFIIDGVRTPIGKPFVSLKSFTAAELGAIVIKEGIRRNKISPNLVDQVIMGSVVTAGTGQNIAREAAITAGLPSNTTAFMVNNVCGSGLQALMLGVQAILLNEADLIIAGGTESATHNPFLSSRKETDENKPKQFKDSLIYDGLTCNITQKHMGELAESLVQKYNITRDEQDIFSFNSHKKACLAHETGMFFNEIAPLKSTAKNAITKDDMPRANISMDLLTTLPTAFRKGGTITAGNSSAPADGAAALLIASKRFIKRQKIKPRARMLGTVLATVKPENTFEAGFDAIKNCLSKCKLSIKDIDLFEIGESFAASTIFTRNKLDVPMEKLNIFGGDIALGHPLGVAGTRILVTLLNALHAKQLKHGLACISFGGGGAIAVIIQAIH